MLRSGTEFEFRDKSVRYFDVSVIVVRLVNDPQLCSDCNLYMNSNFKQKTNLFMNFLLPFGVSSFSLGRKLSRAFFSLRQAQWLDIDNRP